MSSWKQNIQLLDLAADTRLETTCKSCGYSWYERVGDLLSRPKNRYAFLDEIEEQLRCRARLCPGRVRIALCIEGETEGFTGGLS